MWNDKRSLLLSKLCTLLFGVALVCVLACAPWLVRWVIWLSPNTSSGHYALFLATIYTGGAVAAATLCFLYRLLHNIGLGQVFVAANVKNLRRISWCCIAGGAIAMASGLYYLPWCAVGLAALFAGLIVRVVKNVIAQAVALKEENDYTI